MATKFKLRTVKYILPEFIEVEEIVVYVNKN